MNKVANSRIFEALAAGLELEPEDTEIDDGL
jgi:hypothetical protein